MEYVYTYEIREDYKNYKENQKIRIMYLKNCEKYAQIGSFIIPSNTACEKMLDYYEIINKLSVKISEFENLLYYNFSPEEIEMIDFFLTHTIAECAEAWKISYRSVFRKISSIDKKYKGYKYGTINK